jgi:hypothetical protein
MTSMSCVKSPADTFGIESTRRATSNVFSGAARFRQRPSLGSVPAMADTEENWDFTGLKAMYINGTLKRSPEVSNTEGLIEVSASIMRRHRGVYERAVLEGDRP